MSEIYHKITFTPHSTNYNSMSNSIIRNNVLTKTMPFGFMTGLMINKSCNILSRKIIFCWNWLFFAHIYPFFCYLFLLWILEIFLLNSEVFTESNYVYTLAMLWHTKIHCINNLGVRYNIADLIKSI